MEGALLLRNEAPHRAVLLDHVVRADLCLRVAYPIDCFDGALHAGVVQNQHVDRADVRRFAAGAIVGRKALAYIGEGHATEKMSKKATGDSAAAGGTSKFAIFYHGSRSLPTRPRARQGVHPS